MQSYPIYFDYNATTPCDPQVIAEMLPYFTQHFGNAASKTHAYGWVAEEAVEIARERVAALINASVLEIVFTSGATESVNLAIRGMKEAYASKGNHIITYATEHKAVLDVCHYLEKKGMELTVLPVDATGLPDLHLLEQSIKHSTVMVAAMYANNETGVIMPVKEIAAIAQKHNLLFFCDATQAVGKIPVDVFRDGIHAMAFSGHKMYGPKGVGALYVRRKNPRITITPLQYGGGHERQMRSGTLNVPGIVGLGKACELCLQNMQEDAKRMKQLRKLLLEGISDIKGLALNGDQQYILPHVANIRFDVPGGKSAMSILNKTLAVSSGSACMSASAEPSYVLKAMGLSDENAASSIRFSMGRFTTEEDVQTAVDCIRTACSSLKQYP
jgi:cysteine desulfurase